MAGNNNIPELLNAPLKQEEYSVPPMNMPYVRQYNEAGELTNPITKEEPYLHMSYSTRGMRRGRILLVPQQLPSGRYTSVLLRKTRSQKRQRNWHILN